MSNLLNGAEAKEFFERIDLPQEAFEAYDNMYKKVCDTDEFKELIQMIKEKAPFGEMDDKCTEYAKKLNVNEHIFYMTVLVSCVNIVKERYLKKGINEDIFWKTAYDFNYKINECKKVYNVWGVFAKLWYSLFFDANLVRFGRLEYETRRLKDGKIALWVHIPSSGPLIYSDVMASYKMAYDFFEKSYGNLTAFFCGTWLFFPDYQKTIFKEGSNTYNFAKDFDIVTINYTDNFEDAWRVFHKDYTGDTSVLPTDTSMQKAFIEYIKKGGRFGTARGAFTFDGEKIYHDRTEKFRELI